MIQHKTKGFTLIELLVVIAIIGVLSSVVLASLNTARAKARDAKRLTDLKQLQIALELYANSNNGSYPLSSSWQGNCPWYGGYGTSGSTGYIPNLAPTYIPVLPLDPKQDGGGLCYLYNSNGNDYMLLAHYTVETNTGANNPAKRHPVEAPGYFSYAVYTSGGAGW